MKTSQTNAHFTTLLILLSPLFLFSSASAEIYLQADFDNKPLGAVIGTGGPEVGEPVYNNSYVLATVENQSMPTPCLRLEDNSTVLAGAVDFELIDSQEVTTGHCIISCNLWFEEYGLYNFYVREQGGASFSFISVNFSPTGDIFYNSDGGGYGLIGTYEPNKYYPLWIDFNMDAGTYNFWFDLSPLLINETFGPSAYGIGKLSVGSGFDGNTGDAFCIDDIYISDQFAPYKFLQANFNNKTLNAPIGTGGFEVGEPMQVNSSITAIVRETPHHTPSLEIQDNHDYGAGYARFEFFKNAEVIGGDLYLLAHLRFDEYDSYKICLRENQSGAAENFLDLHLAGNGNINCSDGGGTVGIIATYETDRIYEFLAVYDLNAGTYDIYWDGALVLNDEPHDIVSAGIGSILFGCANDANYLGRFYVDNIFVWQVPTPTSAVCCMDTDCGVMIPMDCTYNSGDFHPEWNSCVPNVCDPMAAVDVPLPADATRLMPVSPNPFTGTTTLNYQLAESGVVRIEIYDATGRHIKTLLRSLLDSGPGRVEWDGCNTSGIRVNPGVYFGRLITKNEVVSQRMIVLK